MPDLTTIDYKILFEVRVLHDYYLLGIDPLQRGNEPKVEKSFFAMDPTSQSARLQELLRRGRYDIRKDLRFVPGATEQRMFDDLHLRMLPTPTGFCIALEVKAMASNGDEVRFQPAIAPPDDTALTFAIAASNPSFGAISNLRLDKDSPNIYYFTNDGDHDGMSLSTPIDRLVPGQRYRMGDLARIGQELRQAVADNTGDPHLWEAVSGEAFVNQSDRGLNPDEPWYKDWVSTLPLPFFRPVGVIRILLKLKRSDSPLSPIDKDGFLSTRKLPGQPRPVHPVFELRFLSMATYWRYHKIGGFSSDEAAVIEKHAGKFLDRTGTAFATKRPRHLARELPHLPLDPPTETLRIPNAQPGSIKAGNGRLFSEIYLNFIPTKT